MAQSDSLADVRAYGAKVSLHGAAADPTWGILTARHRYGELKRPLLELRKAGIPAITWVEGFGDVTTYVAALAYRPNVIPSQIPGAPPLRVPGGKFLRQKDDPTLPVVLLNHWGWQGLPNLKQPFRTVWMGPQAYYNEESWAAPYTRSHPRYGAPIPRYPDGRPALGYAGTGVPHPASSRLFDAGGAKDLNGRLRPVWGVNPKANAMLSDPANRRLTRGLGTVTVGTDEIDGPPPGLPGARVFATHASIHKDAACPFWLDYARASFRQILDLGLDGLWCDNFSAWDNFGYPPLEKAFGDWSVARFGKEAARWGLANPGAPYDVRADLKARFRSLFPGHDPADLTDPGWRDSRWLDDPAWRAYRAFKRRTGAEALSGLYRIAKREARAKGKPDFLVTGNDVPLYALGWVRPSYLDMVNTELTPGWHMGTGDFGTGMPPEGRLSPVYRLMTEHARAPYAVAWLYLEGEYAPYRTKPNAFRALAAEAMLGRTMLLGYDSSRRTAGTPPEHKEWNRFVDRMTPVWRGRTPYAEAAVLWSPSSQLAYMAPGGYPDMDAQPHTFGYFGWSTFLEEAHVPYRALPEFAATPAALNALRLLVLPDVECMTDPLARRIEGWVKRGGTLIITGGTGSRYGEDRADARRQRPLFAGERTGPAGRPTRWGKGRVIYTPGNPGMDYYVHRHGRAERFPALQNLLAPYTPSVRLLAPRSVGMSVYRTPGGEMQIDLANLNLDRNRDRVPPAHNLKIEIPPGTKTSLRRPIRFHSSSDGDRKLKIVPHRGLRTILVPRLTGFSTLRVP